MNVTSAERHFETVTWYVLNEIKRKLILKIDSNRKIIYFLNIDITRINPNLLEERAALESLCEKKIIQEFDEKGLAETGEPGSRTYKVEDMYYLKVLDGFEEYYDRVRMGQDLNKGICWFDNNTFFLTLQDNSVKTISFDTERSSRQVLALFQTIVEHWKKNGDKPIAGGEIVKAMARYGSRIDTIQLKNIISNVRNKKVKPAGLENKIRIEHDRKANGWRIDIKR